jgi:hypothetical protein
MIQPLFREKGGDGGGGVVMLIFVVHGTYRVNDLLGNAGHDDDDDNFRCCLSSSSLLVLTGPSDGHCGVICANSLGAPVRPPLTR